MGTEETFQLLERRAKEAVERIRVLQDENKKLKTHNKELIVQKERVREKARELLNKLCLKQSRKYRDCLQPPKEKGS